MNAKVSKRRRSHGSKGLPILRFAQRLGASLHPHQWPYDLSGRIRFPESRQKYAQIVSGWSAGNLDAYGKTVSIARLCVAFTKHAESYYVKDGKPTTQAALVRCALKPLVDEFGNMQADRFLPKHLEKMQQVSPNTV